jgi:hypothetical protein
MLRELPAQPDAMGQAGDKRPDCELLFVVCRQRARRRHRVFVKGGVIRDHPSAGRPVGVDVEERRDIRLQTRQPVQVFAEALGLAAPVS